jgi:hypothetical protein
VAAVALAAAPRSQKLRVGVFADSPLQPRWIVEAFARLAASEFAGIEVLAVPGEHPRPALSLWRVYARLDRWAFRSSADVSERMELAAGVAHRQHIEMPEPQAGAAANAAWREALGRLGLDVAFALGGTDDKLLEGLARYGVWRFCFGEERSSEEPLAGFREVAEGAQLTASGLKVRLAANAGERLAYHSCSRTYPFSVARNRNHVLLKSADFPYRALRELHRSGEGWLERCPHLAIVAPPRGASEPGGGEVLRHAATLGARLARRGLQKALFREQWFLGFRFGEGSGWSDLNRFRRLMPPKDRFWADPFPMERNGRYFIFFEELLFASGKAHISMVEVFADGRASPPVRVLERDYHLSYPFLLEDGGELYMVPETAEKRTVEVYRCVEFPRLWRPHKTLLEDVRLVDATFHRDAERWWMFANAASEGTSIFDDELQLYHAERFPGKWHAHARNPVKSDARCARPAGRLYSAGGALYRPSQVCVPLYGAGVAINRVLRLDREQYAERQVQRILPPHGGPMLGLHTVNRAGALAVIDGFTRTPRLSRSA